MEERLCGSCKSFQLLCSAKCPPPPLPQTAAAPPPRRLDHPLLRLRRGGNNWPRLWADTWWALFSPVKAASNLLRPRNGEAWRHRWRQGGGCRSPQVPVGRVNRHKKDRPFFEMGGGILSERDIEKPSEGPSEADRRAALVGRKCIDN